MRAINGRTMNGTVNHIWQSFERQLDFAGREVAAHPEAGLLVAAVFGMLFGIWIKRR